MRLRISRGFAALRHAFRRRLGLVLARLLGPRHYQSVLSLDGVRSVLVCRINGRMGNTLFLTPLIRHLHELLPDAVIDLAVANARAPELLGDMPGVRQVVLFPHKTDRMVRRFLSALRRVRATRYDLAIDPVPESNSGRAVMTLCRARRRLGFVTNFQWAPLTHAVSPPRDVMHQAAHPVYLIDRAIGREYSPGAVRLWLPLREDERYAGQQVVARAIGRTDLSATRQVIGYFAHAAGYKMLGREWWLQFWNAFTALEPDAIAVECLPTAQHQRTDERFAGFHVASPRGLSAAIASMRMFVSTDTGPMHLASSTSVPTVALFRASDPMQYGPLKPNDLSIDVSNVSPNEAARLCQAIWQASAGTAWPSNV
ncbi:MAG TPA: glycosyltransferase family 9 protein [Steroidobacteraceae bacterium]|nr:glycosyltransferase family 9 protein [Steroidobacteraceae bacterium]